MELSELYSQGTKMSEVSIHFRGMTLLEWRMAQISVQAAKHYAKLAAKIDVQITPKRVAIKEIREEELPWFSV